MDHSEESTASIFRVRVVFRAGVDIAVLEEPVTSIRRIQTSILMIQAVYFTDTSCPLQMYTVSL
jgi:hypothetical protein